MQPICQAMEPTPIEGPKVQVVVVVAVVENSTFC